MASMLVVWNKIFLLWELTSQIQQIFFCFYHHHGGNAIHLYHNNLGWNSFNYIGTIIVVFLARVALVARVFSCTWVALVACFNWTRHYSRKDLLKRFVYSHWKQLSLLGFIYSIASLEVPIGSNCYSYSSLNKQLSFALQYLVIRPGHLCSPIILNIFDCLALNAIVWFSGYQGIQLFHCKPKEWQSRLLKWLGLVRQEPNLSQSLLHLKVSVL